MTEIFWLDDDHDLAHRLIGQVNHGVVHFGLVLFREEKEFLSEIARRHPFAVVLDDGFSGSSIGLLHRIKKLSPVTHVIIVAFHARAEAAIHAINEGASDYLPKNPMLAQRLGRLLFQLDKVQSVKNAFRLYGNVYVMVALAILLLIAIVFMLTRY